MVNIRTVKTVKGGGRVFRHFFGNPYDPRDPFFNREPFSDERAPDFKQRSLGSGFIIDRDGYIVTNNHVIEGADEIKVSLANDKEFDGEIVGRERIMAGVDCGFSVHVGMQGIDPDVA